MKGVNFEFLIEGWRSCAWRQLIAVRCVELRRSLHKSIYVVSRSELG
ncbi:hypothetical protein DO73_4631 [Burkholderia pseudomallei]|nr:hypothetical protein DO73_4631 [Burkholderia pseudomallei]